MNKTERLSFIENLIRKNSSGKLEAHSSEVEEEKKLILSNDSDSSILDEEEKDSFVNPVLAASLDSRLIREEEKEDDTLISKREMKILSRELGRPVSFLGVKRTEEKEELCKLSLTKEEMDETLAWAEKKAAS